MRIKQGACCLLLCMCILQISAAVSAERDVRAWLSSMVESVRTLNYHGTFVFLHDNQLESMQITHIVDSEGEKERLVSLNGAAREVVRDDASVTCVAPDAKSISVSRRGTGGAFRAVFSMDVDALSEYYDFQLLNRARVVGRETQVVAILPKDAYRYGYRIYLDVEKSLPLQTDMVDDKGAVIAQIMFTSIEIDPGVAGMSEQDLDGREYFHWVQREAVEIKDEPDVGEWALEEVPRGYRIRLRAQMPGGAEASPVNHLLLTDGLASLSLYIEPKVTKYELTGSSRMGAVNAFGRVVDGHQITAVGAVPAVTVERIAGALKHNAN